MRNNDKDWSADSSHHQEPEEQVTAREEPIQTEQKEETGMDKPKDFSPVPPPRKQKESHSVMPPPVSYSKEEQPDPDQPELVQPEVDAMAMDGLSLSAWAEDDVDKEEGTQKTPMATAQPEVPEKPEKPEKLEKPQEQRVEEASRYYTPDFTEDLADKDVQEVQEELEQASLDPEEASSERKHSQDISSDVQSYPPYQGFDYQRHGTGYPKGTKTGAYRWDYADYEEFQSKPEQRKDKGVAGFIITLVLCLTLVLSGLGITRLVTGNRAVQEIPPGATEEIPYPTHPGEEQPGVATPQGEGEGSLSLNITETPDRKEELPPAGEILTIPQAAQKVIPSVVGVLRYSGGNLYEDTGLGSGIVIGKNEEGDIYIVSNAHVVEQGTNFMINTHDNHVFDAVLIGADARSDLAVLKISASDLEDYEFTPAEFGTSEKIIVGEDVIAIGNPIDFSLSGSVTRGIVSAVERRIETESSYRTYIQTDAAINPGNSGGALANVYGQVIGINTLKVNAADYEGIGFAIPISEAIPLMEELVEHGRVISRAMVGITAVPVMEGKSGNIVSPAGLMVYEVSPYARTKPEIKAFDIITHVNGERVFTSGDLYLITEDLTAGETIELTVFRKSSTVATETITVTVELISSADFG